MPLEKFPRLTLPERISQRRRLGRINRTYTLRAIMIMLLSFAAAAALLLAFSGARAESATSTMYVSTESGPLNVRERASLHSDVVARLERGEAVEVIRMDGGWALIKGGWESGEGWANAKYLVDKPPALTLAFTVEEDCE